MRYCLPICEVFVSSHLWTVPRQIWFWISTKSCDSVRPLNFGKKNQLDMLGSLVSAMFGEYIIVSSLCISVACCIFISKGNQLTRSHAQSLELDNQESGGIFSFSFQPNFQEIKSGDILSCHFSLKQTHF